MAFKPQYFDVLLADTQRVDFIEIHAENYFGDGGVLHAQLRSLREQLPLSIHGVGLSLGGSLDIDRQHLQRLQRLCARYEPTLVSEHLAWSNHGSNYLADLLPVAYNVTTLNRVVTHVQQLQEALGRKVLIENPASYLRLEESDMSEADFLRQLCQQSGCDLLLDLNNLLVSCHNCSGDPQDFLARLPLERVAEIHLAGHSQLTLPSGECLLLDDHGSTIADATWELYVELLLRSEKRPTLIEWDNHLPSWDMLAAEVDCARALQCSPYMPPSVKVAGLS